MGEWRPLKTAITWGVTGVIALWLLGWHPGAFDFGFIGTMGFITAVYEEKKGSEKLVLQTPSLPENI